MKTNKNQGFQATALQVRRAWENHYGKPTPGTTTYEELGQQLVKDLGLENAKKLILSQSDDPNHD